MFVYRNRLKYCAFAKNGADQALLLDLHKLSSFFDSTRSHGTLLVQYTCLICDNGMLNKQFPTGHVLSFCACSLTEFLAQHLLQKPTMFTQQLTSTIYFLFFMGVQVCLSKLTGSLAFLLCRNNSC